MYADTKAIAKVRRFNVITKSKDDKENNGPAKVIDMLELAKEYERNIRNGIDEKIAYKLAIKKSTHTFDTYSDAIDAIKAIDDKELIYDGYDDYHLDKDDKIITGIYCDPRGNGRYDFNYLHIDISDVNNMNVHERGYEFVGLLDYSKIYTSETLKYNERVTSYIDEVIKEMDSRGPIVNLAEFGYTTISKPDPEFEQKKPNNNRR